jgi:hypothetical protein
MIHHQPINVPTDGAQAFLKDYISPFLPWMSQKATKGLIALTPEIDYDQTAIAVVLRDWSLPALT